jgi:hypothetical protein
MVAGVLVAHTLTVAVSPLPTLVTNWAIQSGLNGHLVGALHFLAGWIAWMGAAAIAYWILCRQSSWRDRVVAASLQRPVLIGLGLFIGLECLPYLMMSVYHYATPLYELIGRHDVVPSPKTIAIINSWFFWGYLLKQSLWVAAGPLLAGYAWRKRGSPASGSASHYELQPGEQEAARALQSQGLSLDEAGLVLARRRGPQEVVAPSLAQSTDRGTWLERAVWMVTGVALSQCLRWLVLEPAWLVAMASSPAAPLLQHVAALASVCLGPALAAAILASLWRWIVRHPSQSTSIGRVCRLRPVLAAIALAVVCAGIWCCWYGLFRYVVRPANSGVGAIGSQWMIYGGAVTQLIIPIALLLWLARRWRGMQTSPAPFH